MLPNRATSGPNKLIDARNRPASSADTSVDNSPSWRMTSEPLPTDSTVEPIDRSSCDMMSTSMIPGTLVNVNSPSARTVAAMSFNTEFFAPGTRTSPSSGPSWSMRMTGSASPPAISVLSCGTATVCSRRDGNSGHSNSDTVVGT